MTTFTVKFDCDNAAFDDDMATEIAEILRGVAERVEQGAGLEFWETIRDRNGNEIGRFACKEPGREHLVRSSK